MAAPTVAGFEPDETLQRFGDGTWYAVRDRDDLLLRFLELPAQGPGEAALEAAARTAGALDHPRVIALHAAEVVVVDRRRMLGVVTDRYDDIRSMERVMLPRAPMREQEILHILREIVEALAAVDALPVPHGWVTPNRIYLDDDGHLLLCHPWVGWVEDLVEQGRTSGTSSWDYTWLAPEQACGEGEPDLVSDLFVACAMAYTLATGRPPIDSDSMLDLGGDLLPPVADPRGDNNAISERLAAILTTGLAMARGDRYQDAASLIADIDAAVRRRPPPLASSTVITAPARRADATRRRSDGAAPSGEAGRPTTRRRQRTTREATRPGERGGTQAIRRRHGGRNAAEAGDATAARSGPNVPVIVGILAGAVVLLGLAGLLLLTTDHPVSPTERLAAGDDRPDDGTTSPRPPATVDRKGPQPPEPDAAPGDGDSSPPPPDPIAVDDAPTPAPETADGRGAGEAEDPGPEQGTTEPTDGAPEPSDGATEPADASTEPTDGFTLAEDPPPTTPEPEERDPTTATPRPPAPPPAEPDGPAIPPPEEPAEEPVAEDPAPVTPRPGDLFADDGGSTTPRPDDLQAGGGDAAVTAARELLPQVTGSQRELQRARRALRDLDEPWSTTLGAVLDARGAVLQDCIAAKDRILGADPELSFGRAMTGTVGALSEAGIVLEVENGGEVASLALGWERLDLSQVVQLASHLPDARTNRALLLCRAALGPVPPELEQHAAELRRLHADEP